MIQSKKDLKYYLSEDLKRFNNHKPNIKAWLLHNEIWYIFHYIRHLRYVEYYKNTNKNKILFFYHLDRKSTRLNSSHASKSRMPSSA